MNEGAVTRVGRTRRLARGKRQVREVAAPPVVARAANTLVVTEDNTGAAAAEAPRWTRR